MAQFLGVRQHKKLSTHLLLVSQHKDESLRDYVVRFNIEAIQVEGYSDGVVLMAMIVGLKHGKFF